MKWARYAIMAAALGVWLPQASYAEHVAQRQEAITLVKQAVANIRTKGLPQALKDFNNPKGIFVDGELYVVVLDLDGKCLAHGANSRIVGKDLFEFRDVNGKSFVKDEIQLAKSAGKGWVEFTFLNPSTQKMGRKAQYLEREGDVIVLSGVYVD